MEKNNKFCIELKKYRIKSGLTQQQLAARVGVDTSYLSRIENGLLPPPSEIILTSLAEALNIDPAKLVRLSGRIPQQMAQELEARAKSEFGPKLRDLRNKAGLSQWKLAESINVNPSYISKLENGTMPPPSRKILVKLAAALNIDEDDLTILAGKKKPGRRFEVNNPFRIDQLVHITRGVGTMNIKSFARVAASLLLVIAVGTSLWFASPTPVKALGISFETQPSSGERGSTHTFEVQVNIALSDLLPVDHIDMEIYKTSDPSTYKATLANLPLADSSSQAHTITEGTSSGSVLVTAVAASAWGYGTGSRTGYGYRDPEGWGYHTISGTTGGYGYGTSPYTGVVASITYTVVWTSPSGWPVGTDYNVKTLVYANGSNKFSGTSSSFTLSAAAAAAAPTPPTGVESVTSSENVSDIVDETGKFTRLATISSADDGATLAIPRGTVGLTAEGEPLSTISITNVNRPDAPPKGTTTMGIFFDCEPSGATFNPPALLTFEYNPDWIPAGATPENLTIAYYDADTGRWVELGAEDIEIDPATNTITARVSHFTVFSTLVRINPAAFEVSGLKISPTSADVAEKVNISATVVNTGDRAGSYEVVLKINGQVASFKKVSVAGGDSEQVTFTTVQGKAGSYSVSIDGLSGTFTVKAVVTAPIVIAPSVPQVVAPEIVYPPAPPAPAPPVAPAPIPAPTPWLPIIIVLVVMGIVAGILIWNYGFRRE